MMNNNNNVIFKCVKKSSSVDENKNPFQILRVQIPE